IGTSAEHAVLARADHHDLYVRMLETQPLHGVRELNVDAEVVGIELELVALEQAAVFVDVHRQGRDVARDIQLPVPVAGRIGLEIDVCRAPREDAIFTGLVASHWGHPCASYALMDMHYNACYRSRLAPNAGICILLHFIS